MPPGELSLLSKRRKSTCLGTTRLFGYGDADMATTAKLHSAEGLAIPFYCCWYSSCCCCLLPLLLLIAFSANNICGALHFFLPTAQSIYEALAQNFELYYHEKKRFRGPRSSLAGAAAGAAAVLRKRCFPEGRGGLKTTSQLARVVHFFFVPDTRPSLRAHGPAGGGRSAPWRAAGQESGPKRRGKFKAMTTAAV